MRGVRKESVAVGAQATQEHYQKLTHGLDVQIAGEEVHAQYGGPHNRIDSKLHVGIRRKLPPPYGTSQHDARRVATPFHQRIDRKSVV